MEKLGRLLGNASWLFVGDFLGRLSVFVLYALVARWLGTTQFGQLSLGLTLLSTFQLLATMGLKSLVIREVSRDLTATGSYLANGGALVTGMALVAMLGMYLLSIVLGYSLDTRHVIALLSLTILPTALSTICEALLQAHGKTHLITLTQIPVHLLRMGSIWVLLELRYDLDMVLISNVALYVLGLALLVVVLARVLGKQVLSALHLTERGIRSVLRMSKAFLGIEVVYSIAGSSLFIVVSKLLGEDQLALYNAGTQLLSVASMITLNLVAAAYPVLCRAATVSPGSMRALTSILWQLMLSAVLPLVLTLIFFSPHLFRVLYGRDEFAAASVPLQVLAWALACQAVNGVFGRVLVANNGERAVMRSVLAYAVATVVLAPLLTYSYGLMGAACAAVGAKLVDVWFHYQAVAQRYPGMAFVRQSIWPAMAAGGLALYWMWAATNLPWVLALGSGIGMYFAFLGARLIARPGHWQDMLLHARAGMDGPAA